MEYKHGGRGRIGNWIVTNGKQVAEVGIATCKHNLLQLRKKSFPSEIKDDE